METYHIDYCMRGYHVYKEVWQSKLIQMKFCLADEKAVGHVPHTISAVCSMFLLQGGSISCQVTGTTRYLIDLPQGGLELPCRLSFTGPQKVVGKLQKLLNKALELPQGTNSSAKEEPSKKQNEAIALTQKGHSSVPNSTANSVDVNAVWMMYQCHTLLFVTQSDKRGLLTHFFVLQYTGKCNKISPLAKKFLLFYIHPHCISY